MAYTFGARIDDDSYALTTIDEDQGTASTKGEINGVPFEGSGGGGEGYLGLHTATVNVTFDTSNISGDIADIGYAYLYLKGSNNSNAIQFGYGESGIPVAELGTPTQMQIPVSDDYSAFIDESTFSWLNTSSSGVMLAKITVVSGDATQVDEFSVLITGDCSLNIKVQYEG